MLVTALLWISASQTWTVDDDGPADFSSIVAAVAAVSPGDTLLVMPGFYQAALIDKELILVGPAGGPRPKVDGELTVVGAPSFTLAGFDLENLRVEGVTGRGRVDDCAVNGQAGDSGLYGTFRIVDCSAVEVSRTTSVGKKDFSTFLSDGSTGLTVEGSHVALVDCVIVGGDGGPTTLEAGYGWEGLYAQESTVQLAGCRVSGGDSGDCSLKGGCGQGGVGVYASFSASVNVRGSSFHLIQGGVNGTGVVAKALSGSSLTWSGVSTLGSVAGTTHVDPPEPYIAIGGQDGPGLVRRLKLYAPGGTPAVALGSLGPALFDVPVLDGGQVWIDPGAVFVTTLLITEGQDAAATQDYALPPDPALAGITALFQAALLPSAGAPYLTNPSNVVLRF